MTLALEPIQNLFNNPLVTDICINAGVSTFFDAGQGMIPHPHVFSQETCHQWVVQTLARIGKSWDARNPYVDGTLPEGYRLHVVFPPLAPEGLLISLRKLHRPQNQLNLNQAHENARQRWGTSRPAFDFICEEFARGENIIIAGATGSGKTTLACDLLGFVPESERMIALEDTAELTPIHPHFLRLVSRPPNSDGFGEVTLRTLLKQTLRMRPDRIILGECRGSEVLDLIQALNTGHRGTLATLHANSPRDALKRLDLLCQIACDGKLPVPLVRELIASGLNYLVQVERKSNRRSISEIHQLTGMEGDVILTRPLWVRERFLS